MHLIRFILFVYLISYQDIIASRQAPTPIKFYTTDSANNGTRNVTMG